MEATGDDGGSGGEVDVGGVWIIAAVEKEDANWWEDDEAEVKQDWINIGKIGKVYREIMEGKVGENKEICMGSHGGGSCAPKARSEIELAEEKFKVYERREKGEK